MCLWLEGQKTLECPLQCCCTRTGRTNVPEVMPLSQISHRYTPKEQPKKHTALADIVVSAAGIPNLIAADMIKEGAPVIDVGINRIQNPITAKPKLVGDVDFEGVTKKAGYITPVPGGVGPMRVAMLMKNTIIAAKKVLRLEEREVLKSKELGVARGQLCLPLYHQCCTNLSFLRLHFPDVIPIMS
ncbi:bifunctional methylenetetrahydrofolate dehydrogenase/cyclohydrolase, mitochondrial-like [Physeter macrocephalus]|uniref:Bifunctional methylenetetrahydrofolate dehydrogenase/cyclohydrolase, mitochondrial-like n=1 Tax=Physeter macrocephalus TaxID=9755 RepID=A0A9W2X142_PHYMC|nr:bifunctional methylenetetrahydrofolate dehydrogenase/cyclohydrolase, mitochondrial-like [Physeter catodon]